MLAAVLVTGGCVTTTVNPDGTVIQTEPDYEMIQLLSTASVGAWAAMQKDGISPYDAEALMGIIGSISEYHKDGTTIDPNAWSVAIAKQVPKRYQALAVVMVQLTAHELAKFGVSTEVPSPDSVSGKIMNAIVNGAKLGLSPYLPSAGTIWEDRTVVAYEA